MTGNGIPSSSSLSLVSTLPPPLLSSLSSRILSRIHRIKFGDVLSEEELTKLSQASSLSLSDSKLVVEALTLVFRDAAFSSKRPTQLTKELKEIDVDIPDEHVDALVGVWSKDGPGTARTMKKESASIVGGTWLENVSWELGVSLASSSSTSSAPPECKALVHFLLRDSSLPSTPTPTAVTTSPSSSGDEDQLCLEFNHEELYNFYQKLEAVQERIDALAKVE